MSKLERRLSRKEKRRNESQTNYIVNNRFNMRGIEPLTPSQEEFFDDYDRGYNIAAIGTAGTGKTMCAMYLGLRDILSKPEYEKLIIVRSAVQTREMGFMPGNKQQKEAVFTTPYADVCVDLFQRGDAWDILKQKNMVEFTTSSFVRGLTFDNSVIIVDECQSMTLHELDSIITRVGMCSKIIFCGDTKQDDLQLSRNRADVTGLPAFIQILEKIPSFRVVNFGINDIVRSGLVKEYILAKEGYNPERYLKAV
jgi:phosphate starvation-inducible protein PhoH